MGQLQGNREGPPGRGVQRGLGEGRGASLGASRGYWGLSCRPVSMMHQQAASSHYNSAQGGSQHYQGQSSIAMMGQSGQGSSMMAQRPMAPYRPSQQGKPCGDTGVGAAWFPWGFGHGDHGCVCRWKVWGLGG